MTDSETSRALVRITGTRCREPEFLLQLPLDGNDGRRIDAQWQLEMQSRRNILEIFTKTLHDSNRVARHCVIRCPYAQASQNDDNKENDTTRATTWHDLLETIPRLPD